MSKFLGGCCVLGVTYWNTRNTFCRTSTASPARCCGIVGYLGSKDAHAVLLDGIRLLQNRGYDSCGISTISPDHKLFTTKFASQGTTYDSVDLLTQHAPQVRFVQPLLGRACPLTVFYSTLKKKLLFLINIIDHRHIYVTSSFVSYMFSFYVNSDIKTLFKKFALELRLLPLEPCPES